MHLVYGGVPLALERTEDFTIRSVPDPGGMDILYQEVIVDTVTIFHPYAVATRTAPVAPAPGDRIGLTINNLKSQLSESRQQAILTLGPDRTLIAPLNHPVTGLPLACDPAGGPFVERLKITEIIGDYAAVVSFRLRFYVLDTWKFVLSNRWSVRSVVDGNTHLTTRHVEGRAILRLDALNFANPTILPDQFRAAFALGCPAGFIRKNVSALSTPDGRESLYTVVDQQVYRNLGTGSPALKVEGNATAGVDLPFKNLQGLMGAIGGLWGAGFGALPNPLGSPLDNIAGGAAGLAGIAAAWGKLIPTAQANVMTKVSGKPDARMQDLVTLATQVCLDRFAPLAIGTTLFPVSAFCTTDHGNENGPWCMMRMEFLPISPRALAAMLSPAAVGGMLNMAADVTLGGAMAQPLKRDPAIGNPTLPASHNTRGSYVAFLITQALSSTTSVVPNVPADGVPARPEFPFTA